MKQLFLILSFISATVIGSDYPRKPMHHIDFDRFAYQMWLKVSEEKKAKGISDDYKKCEEKRKKEKHDKPSETNK